MSTYKNIIESGLVKTGYGKLNGIIVNSHSSGTLKIFDGLEAGANATGTLTSTGALAAASHASSEIVSSGASVAGTHAVTVFTNAGTNFKDAVAASAVLTADQTAVTAGSTVTIGTTVYTFRVATTAAYEVVLGANAAETMLNLFHAINGTGDRRNYNESTVAHPDVTAVLTSTYVITVTAKVAGTAGNSIAKAEDDGHLDWDGAGAALTGGLAAETVTIGAKVYTFRTTLSSNPTVANEVLIGSSITASLLNLKNAINGDGATKGITYSNPTVAHTQVVASASDATTITLRGRVPGTSLNTVATTETCAAASFPDTTLGGGTGASDAGVTTAGATVTIGSTVYTIVDELSENYGATAVAYQVKKGVSEATLLDNLKLAINGTGTAGTNYSTGTVAHPDVVATTNTDTVQTVRGRVPGTSLNTVATTTTLADTAFADTTLGGGTGNSDAGITTATATITIGTRVYTFVTELSETLGATAIADQIYYVTSVPVALDNLKTAINASGIAGTNYSTGTTINTQVTATTNANDSQVFVAKETGTAGNSIATTSTIVNQAFGAATLASGTGTAGKVICDTITFSAVATTGERFIPLYDMDFTNGLCVTVGGTLNATLAIE